MQKCEHKNKSEMESPSIDAGLVTEPLTEDEMTEEESKYYDHIDKCAAGLLSMPIRNGLPAHSAYLMMKLFDIASNEVRLYTGSLIREHEGVPVYANEGLIKKLKKFLSSEKKTNLKIAVMDSFDGDVRDHPFVKAIEDLRNEELLNADVEVVDTDATLENHFMVVDDSAYRFELDHNPCNAVANFDDPSSAKSLKNIFDTMIFNKNNILYEVSS